MTPTSDNNTYNDANFTLDKNGILNMVLNGEKKHRLWGSTGSSDLRIYNGGSFTLTADDGYLITSVAVKTSKTNNSNSFNTPTGWTCDSSTKLYSCSDGAQSVTFTATATVKTQYIEVTYIATSTDPKAAAPTFSPEDTSELVYDKDNATTITITSADAIIYYSTDGGTTWSSDFSPATVQISDDTTISAYAKLYDSNLDAVEGSESATVTKNYVYQACSFTISHESGSYPEGTEVTITPTPSDATITWMYDDGGEGSMGETSTHTLTDSGTLTVEVTKTGYKPAEGEYTYTVTKSCAAPTFDVTVDAETGYATVAVGATVTISTATTGATIQYRLSEDAEWITGNQVMVTDDCTIYVQITKDGYTTASGSIVVKVQQCEAPAFSATGAVTEGTEITITCATEGSTIYYKKDDATDWTEYTAPIAITEACTLTAYATATGYKDSSEASATYTIKVPGQGLQFELVTSNDEITADDEYIVVYSSGEHTYTLGTVSNYVNTVTDAVTITDDVATFDSDAGVNILTLETNDGTNAASYPFYIKESLGGKYLVPKGSGDTNVYTQDSGAAHSVSLSSGDVYITPSAAATRSLKIASGNATWRYYTSTNGTAGKLYKKAGAATQCKAVTADHESGAYPRGTEITLSSRTEGATISYQIQLDGETEYGETLTTQPIVLTAACTIKAWASLEGLTDSDIATFTYSIATLDAPEVSPASGTKLADGASMTITAIEGSTIFYSIDGGTTYTQVDPVADAETVATVTLNAADFTDPSNAVVTYYATHPNYLSTEPATATYQIFVAKKYILANKIQEGVDYVLAGFSAGTGYIMTDHGNTRFNASTEAITFTNDNNAVLVGNENASTITFRASTETDAAEGDYYMIVLNGSTEQYIYTSSDKSLIWNTTATANNITFGTTDGNAIINCGGNYLRFNNSGGGNVMFRYYSSGQSAVYLYMDEAFVTDVMDPVFSKSNCIVAKGSTITVTCATDGAEIDWTFTDADGNDISSNVTVSYVEGTGWTFDVTQNMTVTAQASKIGMDTSNVVTAEFTICDTDATPRFFKRIASLDDINAGIAAGKKFIIGAYSRFYMSDEGAARPALMSTAERTQTTTAFKLWAAPKQSTTLGVTNFALVGEEDGVVDDGDDEIELFNDGIMAMRTKDNTDDDFAKVAFVDIEYYTGTDRKDYKNVEIPETTQLYSFKIDGRYLCATTGSGTSDKNTLYWQDTQEPMILSMITSTEQVKETDEYLIGRVLCEWIKTVDEAQGDNVVHTYKCLEYNYSGDLNAYASYQQSVASKTQVYPFIYVEEDKTEIVTEIPDIETKYRGATSEAVRKSEGNVGTIQYDNDEPKNSVVPTVTFDLPSRADKTVTGKRPKATVTDFDPDKDVVIVAIVKQHGKYEGKTSIFKSAVGQALSVPIYVDSDVYAYSMLDGYSSTKSGNSATYYLSVDDPTGIVEVGVDEIGVDAKVFNLQGQLLPRPVKGQVVIVAPSYGRAYKALLK